MTLRACIVSCCLLGCSSSLPPLDVDHTTPRVASPAASPGNGQVVIDVADAPDARVDEIVARGKLEAPYWIRYGATRDLTLTKTQCMHVPCAFDAPYGKLDLDVSAGGEHQPFRLTVDETPTYARVRLPDHERPALGILGWTLAGVSLGVMGGGTAMALSDDHLVVPGAVTIGTAALVGIVGVILGVTHPFTFRPGTVAAWSVPR